jgi:hypothetical protein
LRAQNPVLSAQFRFLSDKVEYGKLTPQLKIDGVFSTCGGPVSASLPQGNGSRPSLGFPRGGARRHPRNNQHWRHPNGTRAAVVHYRRSLVLGSALSIAYYHPEFRLVVRHAFHREWGKYRSIRNDTWSSLALFLIVAILPVYFYVNRIPANTDITLLFSQAANKKPGIMISNIGNVTADA